MADYKGYTDVFKGTLIGTESEFTNCIARVNALLASFTEGRFTEYAKSEASAEVADTAVYTLCECVHAAAAQQSALTAHAGISSENTDGYSVSYGSAGASDTINSQEFIHTMYIAARTYLPQHLFYRGVW